jgi:hypothetical protein
MSTARALLGIIGGAAVGYLLAVCIAGIAGPRNVGVSIAIVAACVVGIYLIKAIQADRDTMRRGRDAVWQRRIATGLTGARPVLPNEHRGDR